MQIFVKSIDGQTISCEVEEGSSFDKLMLRLESITQVPVDHMRLSWGIYIYERASLLVSVLAGKTLSLNARLKAGGLGRIKLAPGLRTLAEKYNVNKKVCRKCYARLPPKAHNCRKRKCGHSNDLRHKKKLAELT